MPAPPEDRATAIAVVQAVWAAWERKCGSTTTATVAGLAKESQVEPETLRAMVRAAQAGELRSGPGFVPVARIAAAAGLELNDLAPLVVPKGDPT
ncbi:MAG: hypothetical protein JWM89_1315 [Acidimicrobiales bacterium]|nr:hypothetical protein [Acidimicrobiales bacterium]